MTKPHRATPEQWESIERYAEDNVYDACFLELRARVEALEAAQPHQDKLDRLIAIDRDDPGNIIPEHSSRDMKNDLHPEIKAAYAYVHRVLHTADIQAGLSPAWYGWAIREAFLAGCSHAAALAQPEPVAPVGADIHYAWELLDAEGDWQAGGAANSLEDVQREGNRYLQTYSQDGPHKLIIQRHCVNTIEEVTND
jgi:hypothetical protein